MEANNSNKNQSGRSSAKEKQNEYNENLENQSDTQLNDSAARTDSSAADPSSKDVNTDNGYKQNEAEEMSGEVTRKNREENLDKGGEDAEKEVSINEAENFGGENEITENTKERAMIDHTSRSVI